MPHVPPFHSFMFGLLAINRATCRIGERTLLAELCGLLWQASNVRIEQCDHFDTIRLVACELVRVALFNVDLCEWEEILPVACWIIQV